MLTEHSSRRIPLRDMITDAEKRVRDLLNHFHVTWLARSQELREISRPVRKRSAYPTLMALHTALERQLQLGQETEEMIEYLSQELEEIAVHARRERQNR